MKRFKLDEKLIEKANTLFSDGYIKHMKAYLYANINDIERSLKNEVLPDAVADLYYKLVRLYATVAYFDAKNRKDITEKILPELDDKLIFFEGLSGSGTSSSMKTWEDIPDEPKDANTNDPFEGSTPYFDMATVINHCCKDTSASLTETDCSEKGLIGTISDEWFKNTNATDLLNDKFQCVKDKIGKVEITTKDSNINDLECDYTQPEVRKVCDEDKYKKDLNDLPYFKCATKGGKLENELKFDTDINANTKADYEDDLYSMCNPNENNVEYLANARHFEMLNNLYSKYTDMPKYDIKKSVPDMKFNTEEDKKNLDKYNFVDHPTHYNSYDVEVIEMMRRIWGDEAVAQWAEITAFKYRMRMGSKPTDPISQDIEKEQWYLKKAKELREK